MIYSVLLNICSITNQRIILLTSPIYPARLNAFNNTANIKLKKFRNALYFVLPES